MSTENEVIAYKAFDADMSCRGFKFEVGKTYEQEGPAVICERGFHACLLPFDCFNYYRDSKTWARVRMVSPSEITPDGDTKLVTAKITIEATLSVSDWVRAQCAALLKLVKGSNTAKATTGDYAHSATTGDSAHSATAGNSAIACSLGIAGRAKAAKGSWMVLAEYDADYKVKTVKTFKAGTKGVKADTWYELKNGKLKAVKE